MNDRLRMTKRQFLTLNMCNDYFFLGGYLGGSMGNGIILNGKTGDKFIDGEIKPWLVEEDLLAIYAKKKAKAKLSATFKVTPDIENGINAQVGRMQKLTLHQGESAQAKLYIDSDLIDCICENAKGDSFTSVRAANAFLLVTIDRDDSISIEPHFDLEARVEFRGGEPVERQFYVRKGRYTMPRIKLEVISAAETKAKKISSKDLGSYVSTGRKKAA